jgi:hypothetical protein
MRIHWSRQGDLPSSPHAMLYQKLSRLELKRGKNVPSVEALTATNLSKLSSTRILMASDRESIEACRCDIPDARS